MTSAARLGCGSMESCRRFEHGHARNDQERRGYLEVLIQDFLASAVFLLRYQVSVVLPEDYRPSLVVVRSKTLGLSCSDTRKTSGS
jgi:hypothetical protein